MATQLPPLYYLTHFASVIDWITARYNDLLRPDDHHFITLFKQLSADTQALLVRFVIRRQEPLRWSSFTYAEITHTALALKQLVALDLVDNNPMLTADQLIRLAKKEELLAAPWAHAFSKSTAKSVIADWLMSEPSQTQSWSDWLPNADDQIVMFKDHARMDRFRLLFFGNLYQDWSEFVVTDLGHQRYEYVPFDMSSRPFQHERDVTLAHWLYDISIRTQQGEDPALLFDELTHDIGDIPEFMVARRQKRLFQLGAAAERIQNWPLALSIYETTNYPGKTYRAVRVCEKLTYFEQAYRLANDALSGVLRDDERQQLKRALRRLAKKVGQTVPAKPSPLIINEVILELSAAPSRCVELSACEALTTEARSVHYVENTLLCGLFGLLFWEVIFAPIPGAFFNPYQRGPADLFHPDFVIRRRSQINKRLEQLDSNDYSDQILNTWHQKHGLQNPFVIWPALNEELLQKALSVIPAQHLKLIFQRMLDDLRHHTSGLPDLIAFDTSSEEARYQMIEVKGPNDRLQDNQVRWFEFFAHYGIPAQVLHVQWPSP
ncbi:MAG: VRR-NUC domain-containing protein [Moraxellaceae bacterium]|nr:VRR-NUC domain-containing protein [Moraxellaceae bacterium]MDP1775105.1 VRR-NUC domain-containing protein [Moraxellaceae bacterium]